MSSRETGEGVPLGDTLDLAFQGRAQKRRHGTWRDFQTGCSTHAERGPKMAGHHLLGQRESSGASDSRVGETQTRIPHRLTSSARWGVKGVLRCSRLGLYVTIIMSGPKAFKGFHLRVFTA